MAALALAGITGMYLRQVRRRRAASGLIGYLVFAAGYLAIMGAAFVAAFVLPRSPTTDPGFVNDVHRRRHRRHAPSVTSACCRP